MVKVIFPNDVIKNHLRLFGKDGDGGCTVVSSTAPSGLGLESKLM